MECLPTRGQKHGKGYSALPQNPELRGVCELKGPTPSFAEPPVQPVWGHLQLWGLTIQTAHST